MLQKTKTTDFYRAMLCIHGTSHGPVSVCLSVTSQSSTKTAKRRITQTTPHDSSGTLPFWCQRSPRNSTGVTPYEGTECRWGGSESATFNKCPAISQKRYKIDTYSFYYSRIGSRMHSIEWWHCRWPWVPFNHPIFCILHRHSQLRNGWT